MRRALATTGLLGVVALSGVGLGAGPAAATTLVSHSGTTLAQDVDSDEPVSQDGDDDTGKYGLIGLTGMLGLFGYRHLKNVRSRSTGPIGTVDTDGSGSTRI